MTDLTNNVVWPALTNFVSLKGCKFFSNEIDISVFFEDSTSSQLTTHQQTELAMWQLAKKNKEIVLFNFKYECISEEIQSVILN